MRGVTGSRGGLANAASPGADEDVCKCIMALSCVFLTQSSRCRSCAGRSLLAVAFDGWEDRSAAPLRLGKAANQAAKVGAKGHRSGTCAECSTRQASCLGLDGGVIFHLEIGL